MGGGVPESGGGRKGASVGLSRSSGMRHCSSYSCLPRVGLWVKGDGVLGWEDVDLATHDFVQTALVTLGWRIFRVSRFNLQTSAVIQVAHVVRKQKHLRAHRYNLASDSLHAIKKLKRGEPGQRSHVA